jgi:DNA-binding response OmpR family regulator
MKIIYYLGKDASIFESLESLSKIKKSFIIKRIDFIENINLNDSLLILDDSSRGFIKLINSYSNQKKNNIIVTTKKENITLNSLQSLRFFFKPIKILDLYKEILNKVKNNFNNLDFYINHRDYSLTNKSGKILKLTEKEFKLIDVLIKNNGKAITKKNLLYLVWGLRLEKVDSINTRVLETLISRIRKKIVCSKLEIKIIKNKFGYVLIN